jgi:hypothetical protein
MLTTISLRGDLMTNQNSERVIMGKALQFGASEDVAVWNYVVVDDNAKIRDRTQIGSFCTRATFQDTHQS